MRFRRKASNFIIAMGLTLSLILGAASGISSSNSVEAAPGVTKLSLNQVRKLAIKNSDAIEKIDIQIDSKKAALSSAIKAVSVKEKNLKTFRWSPALKFKFPQKPNLSQAYEFQFKARSIQYEIDKLEHSKVDQVFEVTKEVNSLYVDIVVLEEGIKFNNERLSILKETLEKNRVKLLSQDASQTDIDNMEKSVEKLTQSLTASESELTIKKKKLSNKIGLDVTSDRFKFEDPFVQADLKRDLLGDLQEYTLDRDDNYYEVCIDETSSKLSLETNYRLMKNHYPRKYINMISSYVDSALDGSKIRAKAFYTAYKNFVGIVNEKWNGKKRILFIKIPKVWFQGDIDGDRFIEDDPYTLYSDTLDYQEKRLARVQAEQDLRDTVEESFNNYVKVRTSYLSYIDQVAKQKEKLEVARIRNKAGELTYSEFKEENDTYDELQNSLFDTMKLYSQTLYEFDRLTCGGVTYYLGDLNGIFDATGGGESYVLPEYAEGAHYYIKPLVQNEQFKLGVFIPDEFEINISDFELWINGTQVGNRTPIDRTIRHLALDVENVNRAFIRFYDGDNFIDDVDIDPSSYSGPLSIVKGYKPREDNGREVGGYLLTRNEYRQHYVVEFDMLSSEGIEYYRVKDYNDRYLLGPELRPIKTKFKYLEAISTSIGVVTFEFFDAGKTKLYDAKANTTLLKLYEVENENENQ